MCSEEGDLHVEAGTQVFQQLPSNIRHQLPKDLPSLSSSLDLLSAEVLGEAFVHKLRQCALLVYEGRVKLCKDYSSSLLDMAWEMLHTGHWKDVNINWRYAYTYCSLIKCLCELLTLVEGAKDRGVTDVLSFQTAIDICDMGLLMGAPVMNNILRRLASELVLIQSQNSQQEGTFPSNDGNTVDCSKKIVKKLKVYDEPKIREEYSIARVSCPSLETFRTRYMDAEAPVIITDAIDYWPAFNDHKWTLDYLKKVAGSRTVPVEIGSKYTDEEWSETLTTLRNFIEKFIENPGKYPQEQGGVGYLAQHQLFDQIPELQRDISIPTYCCLGNCNQGDDSHGNKSDDDRNDEDVDVNAWFGPAGTISPLHQDPKHNLLAQVVGHKYLKLFSVTDTPCLYPHKGLLSNTSQVDAEKPDLDKYPLFSQATPRECVLHPGEMLYIPPKCWHYVRSLATSFSVSFWWK